MSQTWKRDVFVLARRSSISSARPCSLVLATRRRRQKKKIYIRAICEFRRGATIDEFRFPVKRVDVPLNFQNLHTHGCRRDSKNNARNSLIFRFARRKLLGTSSCT